MSDQDILTVARLAASQAGVYLLQAYRDHAYGQNYRLGEHSRRVDVEYKGEIDLVTAYDRGSQQIICDLLHTRFPEHAILAEEDLDIGHDKEHLWIIDPIDGTTNFAHGLPMFCISIAYYRAGLPHTGVVYLPVLDEMFYAQRGAGAFVNDFPIRVSAETDLNHALLATGFPYNRRLNMDLYLAPFKRFKMQALGVRRMGSAAIDLAYTAMGRFDGYWEYNLHPWDAAAGALILQEAGGTITDFAGKPFDPFKKECLASNGHIHQAMLGLLQPER